MLDNVEEAMDSIDCPFCTPKDGPGKFVYSGNTGHCNNCDMTLDFSDLVQQFIPTPQITLAPSTACDPNNPKHCASAPAYTGSSHISIGNIVYGGQVGVIDWSATSLSEANIKAQYDIKKEICPDCKGSKIYIGLNKTEPCSNCHGKGHI